MCTSGPGDPGEAFNTAVAALNEVTRLEQVRYDSSAENWEDLLSGLASVITSASRLADSLADHLAAATQRASWRADTEHAGEYPDQLLSAAGKSVHQVGEQLTELSRLIAVARDQVAQLHLERPNRSSETKMPAAAEPQSGGADLHPSRRRRRGTSG